MGQIAPGAAPFPMPFGAFVPCYPAAQYGNVPPNMPPMTAGYMAGMPFTYNQAFPLQQVGFAHMPGVPIQSKMYALCFVSSYHVIHSDICSSPFEFVSTFVYFDWKEPVCPYRFLCSRLYSIFPVLANFISVASSHWLSFFQVPGAACHTATSVFVAPSQALYTQAHPAVSVQSNGMGASAAAPNMAVANMVSMAATIPTQMMAVVSHQASNHPMQHSQQVSKTLRVVPKTFTPKVDVIG